MAILGREASEIAPLACWTGIEHLLVTKLWLFFGGWRWCPLPRHTLAASDAACNAIAVWLVNRSSLCGGMRLQADVSPDCPPLSRNTTVNDNLWCFGPTVCINFYGTVRDLAFEVSLTVGSARKFNLSTCVQVHTYISIYMAVCLPVCKGQTMLSCPFVPAGQVAGLWGI